MIIISRVSSSSDKIRKYKVIVDDKEVGNIKDGETKCFEVDEGNHNIYLKIDWCRSNKLDFYVSKDYSIEFECGSSLNDWKLWFGIIYITFLKNKYLWIKNKR